MVQHHNTDDCRVTIPIKTSLTVIVGLQLWRYRTQNVVIKDHHVCVRNCRFLHVLDSVDARRRWNDTDVTGRYGHIGHKSVHMI